MAVFDIAFQGGGAKGCAFAGVLQVLEERRHQVRRVVGTSAGAITATLLAAGYRSDELLAAVTERVNGTPRLATFMDPPRAGDFSQADLDRSEIMKAAEQTVPLFNTPVPPLLEKPQEEARKAELKAQKAIAERAQNMLLRSPHGRMLFSFVECGGFFEGRAIIDWIEGMLTKKGFPPGVTFKGFAAKGKDLSVVASDTTDMEMLVLNRTTAPDCPVAQAVRMSMSIPFVWREVEWEESWGKYLNRPKFGPQGGNIIVDGGLLSNFPIDLIMSSAESVMDVMGPFDPSGATSIGFSIDVTLPVPGTEDTNVPKKPRDQPVFVQRVARLIDTMTGTRDKEASIRFKQSICPIPAKGYGTLEFDMSPDRLDKLIRAAHDAAGAFAPLKT
jgi:predicted acylesterase/phospholipase RssA